MTELVLVKRAQAGKVTVYHTNPACPVLKNGKNGPPPLRQQRMEIARLRGLQACRSCNRALAGGAA